MKKLIFITLLSLLAVSGWGQNYVRLGDASGYDDGIYDDSLEIASTELINILSNDIQSAFKVFDVGYYLYNSQVNGPNELDSLWIKTKEHITSSHPSISYYILFGRVVYASGKIEIKVEVILPDTDIFYCIDNISPGFRKEIENQVISKANGLLNPQNIFINEIKAIKQLKYIIQNKICCDPEGSGLRFVSCDACMIDTSDCHIDLNGRKLYPSAKEYERLDQLNFVIEAVKIINDEEYFIPADNSAFQGYENQGTRNSSPVNCTIQFSDDEIITVDALKDSFQLISSSINVYTYKYPRDCGSFEKKWNDYKNDSSPALFITLINVDRENGYFAYHFKCCGNSVKGPGEIRNSTTNPTEEDLEGMREALQEANGVCYDLILAYLFKFEYGVDKFFGDFIHSEEELKLHQSVYDNKKQRVESNLNSASVEYGYYYEMEYLIQRKKNNRIHITAKYSAHYNMCSEEIHGVLDMCGVIEPIGLICDGTNAIIYYLKGDYTNGSLSLTAVFPIGGTLATSTKIGTKIAKTAAGSPAGVVYRAVLKPGTGYLHWVGGEKKLEQVMKKAGGTPANLILDVSNTGKRQIHHVIPWEFLGIGKRGFDDDFNKKLYAAGWHPSNPTMNGFSVPEFKNGIRFHYGSHDKYNKVVRDAMEKIKEENLKGDALLNKMNTMTTNLRNELTKAYNNSDGIDKHFLNFDFQKLLN